MIKVTCNSIYHFESVELLLDLLGKHWGKTVASSNLAPTIIFPAWPSIVELNARAEGGISLGSRRG